MSAFAWGAVAAGIICVIAGAALGQPVMFGWGAGTIWGVVAQRVTL